ncbi:uncharacterized protein LOC132750691 [Ruditapes philippinarum]|uniref:uncharacterized protein LOC132750691 n=1 Tax=Ruditapes philippinarum TaxID=129788 RepID=UPI00295AB180|nr:uncharacterized protein LOC132750691 [Ruditapes philippinarum]
MADAKRDPKDPKEKSDITGQFKENKKGKQPARKDVNPSASTSKSPSANENSSEELISILQAMRAEQVTTNKKLESYERRLTQIENYEEEFENYEQYEDETYSESGDGSNKRGLDERNVEGSRFASLAKRFKSVEVCDSELDPVLASNINELFTNGMEEEQYSQMTRDDVNARPSNCENLVTVKLNQLVWDIVSPTARSRDKKLQTLETSVVKAAVILAKTVDKAAKLEKDLVGSWKEGCEMDSLIDGCNDSLALLGHANRQVNMLRRDLLKPEMRNEYAHLCTHSLPYTNQLFGDDVSKTAKEIEECSRIGHRLQYGPSRGSYRGRPGFRPRIRGGFSRGGFRGRGSYGTGEFTQQGSKNFQRRGGNKKM